MGVSLSKGEGVSLSKANNNTALSSVTVGLGWDPASSGGGKKKGLLGGLFGGGGGGDEDIDLDASLGLFGANKEILDQVWYNHLTSNCGAITHQGDNTTGAGDGDDEQIVINLNQVPTDVQTIVVVITSYSGQKFNEVEKAFCRLVNDTGQEVVRYELSEQPACTAMVMMSLTRNGGDWEIKAIGAPTNGKIVGDVIADMKANI